MDKKKRKQNEAKRNLVRLLCDIDGVDEIEWILQEIPENCGINPARIKDKDKGVWNG